jgi:hypothetical protein
VKAIKITLLKQNLNHCDEIISESFLNLEHFLINKECIQELIVPYNIQGLNKIKFEVIL